MQFVLGPPASSHTLPTLLLQLTGKLDETSPLCNLTQVGDGRRHPGCCRGATD